MSPSAKVILDSVSPAGIRLTTMEVVCHRFVLAEFNTHRVFSRNSASSRAIPVTKTLKRVTNSPAMPLSWNKEQPGMQGGDSLEDNDLWDAQGLFDSVHKFTTHAIKNYIEDHPDPKERLHKSLVNRLLEPFMFQTIIVSATDYTGFFEQRCNPDAQPEIKMVADLMRSIYESSTPQELNYDEWHLPYVTGSNEEIWDLETKKKISVARAARVSYLTHDGVRDSSKDVELYAKLVTADPPHWSPLEHVATPAKPHNYTVGNFKGWHQLRHLIANDG